MKDTQIKKLCSSKKKFCFPMNARDKLPTVLDDEYVRTLLQYES